MVSLMLLFVAVLSGCASEKAEIEVPVPPVVIEEPQEPEPMSLLLACAPANSNSALTRLSENVVQSGHTYRSITNFGFIAQTKDGSSVTLSDCYVQNPQKLFDYTETSVDYRYYHSDNCSMTDHVNACLVYAKADVASPPTGVPSKVYNGSLVPDFPTTITFMTSPNEISFSLEPILNATKARETGDDLANWETEAWELANALTGIANVSSWASSENAILKNLFENFTNHGKNIPGSAASVKQWIAVLKSVVNEEGRPSGLEDPEIEILNAIKTKIEGTSISNDNNYPRDVYLPDGAAALRWAEVKKQVDEVEVTEKKFVPELETTTLDNINSVASFAYPPELYYFVDSPIKTSTKKMNYNTYRDETSGALTKTWNEFLSLNDFSDNEVKTSSKTVIVTNPLQYAVAQLLLRVKASDVELSYADGANEKIAIHDGNTTNYIRLTGVIVCGQRPVNYQFVQTDNMNSDVKFVYDSQVGSDFFLTTTGDGKELHSLVLQSYDGEDVNVILEFEYTGPKAFKCLNGYVYPNTRFYLVGEAKLSEGQAPDGLTQEEENELKKRVFTQDHTTTLDMTVTSLKNAYNVLPSLLAKNLEIGVMTTTKWISATPQEAIVMD